MARLAHNLVEVVRAGFRPREPRTRVHVPARMQAGDKWTDITILNISSRGLMARAAIVPPARSYVEIRRGSQVRIVGKVVWHDAAHFGIRTQDRIGVEMMNDSAAGSPPQDNAAERRTRPRADRRDPAEAFERNRHRAALFQFVVLVLGGIIGAALIGGAVLNVLSKPFAMIAHALS